jgi:hypothetical protein
MKKIIQSVLKPFGLRLAHLQSQSATFGLDVLFSFLIKNGFAPRHIIDVGANHGHWTRKAIEYFPDPSIQFLLLVGQAAQAIQTCRNAAVQALGDELVLAALEQQIFVARIVYEGNRRKHCRRVGVGQNDEGRLGLLSVV